jgi:hypothetical protein
LAKEKKRNEMSMRIKVSRSNRIKMERGLRKEETEVGRSEEKWKQKVNGGR